MGMGERLGGGPGALIATAIGTYPLPQRSVGQGDNKMLRRLLFGAGMAYLTRKLMGGNRGYDRTNSRNNTGGLFGGSRRRGGLDL